MDSFLKTNLILDREIMSKLKEKTNMSEISINQNL